MILPLTIALYGGMVWPPPPLPLPEPEVCEASWYGDAFAGRLTANGEVFDPDLPTAAHRELPFGTVLEVSANGRSTTVTINDRGPFIEGRCIDLSRAAFAELAPVGAGVLEVAFEEVDNG